LPADDGAGELKPEIHRSFVTSSCLQAKKEARIEAVTAAGSVDGLDYKCLP